MHNKRKTVVCEYCLHPYRSNFSLSMIFLQGLGGICSAKSDEHLKTKLFDIESQILHIYRMVDVGWDLWRSPSLTRLLRTVSQEAVQDSVHLGFEYFQGWSLYSLSRKQV